MLVLVCESDPVTQVTGFACGLKFSLMMQQDPGNRSLKSQDGPLCIPGAQQALAKQQK